jgi:transitional endoplasmic reticulum ATPase
MYGPPGCGKTHIAKALASECKAKFYLINGPEIMDMHVGEAAKKLRAIYETAQQQKPSIIFIDEIDSIATRRDVSQSQSAQEVITTLLSLMDGLKEIDGIFTIGATNCPEMIDTALLRPGRMGKGIYVNVPDPETREALLNKYLNNKPLEEDVCVEELVDKSHNCSIADIVAIVDTAARIAWRRNGRKATGKINQMDFLKAHESTGSSVSTEKLIAYEQWRNYAFA